MLRPPRPSRVVRPLAAALVAVAIGVAAAGCAGRADAGLEGRSGAATGLQAGSGSRPTPTASPAGVPVEGYVTASGGAAALVRRAGGAVTTVGVDGVVLDPDGAGVGEFDGSVADVVRAAHADGATAEVLVSNYSDRIEDFSPRVGTALLDDPAHRARVVDALVADVVASGADGVQVDLESLRARDRAGLTAFVGELRTALVAGIGGRATVSIAVMASTTRGGYADTGYDVPALTVAADRLVLMTYDQHGPTWSGPGPVGGLPWQRRAVSAFLGAGAAADRVDLGVAGYGYTWPRHGDGRQTSDSAARRTAGTRAVWSSRQGEWHATTPSGTVLWWSDARSFGRRVDLARELGLHGVALWQLQGADPLR